MSELIFPVVTIGETRLVTLDTMTMLLGIAAENLNKPRPATTTVRLWASALGGVKVPRDWVFPAPTQEQLRAFLTNRPKRGRKAKNVRQDS